MLKFQAAGIHHKAHCLGEALDRSPSDHALMLGSVCFKKDDIEMQPGVLQQN